MIASDASGRSREGEHQGGMSMTLTMRTPVCWTMLWLALFVLAGCSRSAPDERSGATDTPPQEQRAEPRPAPQPAPPPAPEAARPDPALPTETADAPVRPEADPQRSRREQGPVAAAPASAPEVGTVGSPPSDEAAPVPVPPAEPQAQSAPTSGTPKPAPTQSVPPKPAAPGPKNAAVDDVVILKGAPIGGVRLEHKLHAERAGNDCTVCHHPSKPQKPAKDPHQACSDCHTKAAAAPMKTRYQAAFHNPTAQSGTCVDCHKAENAKGKKAPLKCQECHKKGNV
jgi:hypothetical protein